MVKTPFVPGYDIYLGEGDEQWQQASRYQVWTAQRAPADPPLAVLERRDGQVLRIPDQSRVFHVIPAGTPYHIEHLFGFWRTSGADTIFIRADVEERIIYTLIAGTHGDGFGSETVAWLCPKCGTELRSLTFDQRRYGLAAFWTFALASTRAFNADEAARTCGCGNLHPPAYGLDHTLDGGPEAAGRAAW